MNRGRQRTNRADGSDVEDSAFALPNHLLIDRFRHREQTPYVRVDDFIPRPIRSRRKVIASIDCGIIDQDVNPAPFLNQLSRQMFYAEAVRYRDFERTRAPTERLNYPHHFFSKVVTRAIVERHFGAFAGKHLAQRRADPAGSTSNKCTFSFEQQTHSYQSFRRRLTLIRHELRAFNRIRPRSKYSSQDEV